MLLVVVAAVAGISLRGSTATAAPLGTAWTYQGTIYVGGSGYTGVCDLRFALYNAASAGAQVGSTQSMTASLDSGLFAVSLDFGSVYSDTALWVGREFRCPSGSGGYTDAGRHSLGAAPIAIYASTAGSATTAASATYATSAGSALTATTAATATYAASAGSATSVTGLELLSNPVQIAGEIIGAQISAGLGGTGNDRYIAFGSADGSGTVRWYSWDDSELSVTGGGTLGLHNALGTSTVLTVPGSGTAVLGTGTANQMAIWSGANTIASNPAVYVNASGWVGIGLTPTTSLRAASSGGVIATEAYNAGAGGGSFTGRKSRSATLGDQAALLAGDDIVTIGGQGSDGSAYVTAAYLNIEADANASAGNVPGRISFWERNAAGSLAERMRLAGSGNLLLGSTTEPIGSSAYAVVIGNGTAPTSSVANASLLYSADYASATDASIHIRAESGTTYRFGGSTLSAPATISATALTIGTPANGIAISATNITFAGTGTVWDDLRLEPSIRGASTANQPLWEMYSANGSSRGVYAYSFQDDTTANQDEVFFTAQMPHSWAGTPIYLHVHWTPLTGVTGTPVWGIEYSWADISTTFITPTVIVTTTGNVQGDSTLTALKHYITAVATLTPTANNNDISMILIGRLYRNSGIAADTANSTKCGLLSIDLHYEIGRIGSNDEYTP